jgi:hypothetical protein
VDPLERSTGILRYYTGTSRASARLTLSGGNGPDDSSHPKTNRQKRDEDEELAIWRINEADSPPNSPNGGGEGPSSTHRTRSGREWGGDGGDGGGEGPVTEWAPIRKAIEEAAESETEETPPPSPRSQVLGSRDMVESILNNLGPGNTSVMEVSRTFRDAGSGIPKIYRPESAADLRAILTRTYGRATIIIEDYSIFQDVVSNDEVAVTNRLKSGDGPLNILIKESTDVRGHDPDLNLDFSLLSGMHSVHEVELNNINTAQTNQLAIALMGSPSVRVLDLGYHTVTDGVSIRGLAALLDNSYPGNDSLLETVHIGIYKIDSDSMRDIATAVENNTTLRAFGLKLYNHGTIDDDTLSDQEYDDLVAEDITFYLEMEKLLTISNNTSKLTEFSLELAETSTVPMHYDEMRSLAESIRNSTKITSLNLNLRPNAELVGLGRLEDSIGSNKNLTKLSLTYSGDQLPKVERALQDHPSILYFHTYNNMAYLGSIRLLQFLESNTKLEEITVGWWRDDDADAASHIISANWDRISQALAENTTVRLFNGQSRTNFPRPRW